MARVGMKLEAGPLTFALTNFGISFLHLAALPSSLLSPWVRVLPSVSLLPSTPSPLYLAHSPPTFRLFPPSLLCHRSEWTRTCLSIGKNLLLGFPQS